MMIIMILFKETIMIVTVLNDIVEIMMTMAV